LPESELNGSRLAQEILSLLGQPSELAALANKARKFARPNATQEIVNLIEQVARP
jgi:UDP-N-acetylglucosamine:LPS N-acetylglucosamine transferase